MWGHSSALQCRDMAAILECCVIVTILHQADLWWAQLWHQLWQHGGGLQHRSRCHQQLSHRSLMSSIWASHWSTACSPTSAESSASAAGMSGTWSCAAVRASWPPQSSLCGPRRQKWRTSDGPTRQVASHGLLRVQEDQLYKQDACGAIQACLWSVSFGHTAILATPAWPHF